jgi:PIN domain nuclease of toxin-antitoxin system
MASVRPLLLDTHVWLWLAGDGLPAKATKRLEARAEAGRLLVCAVSLYEAMVLAEKGRVPLKPGPFEGVKAVVRGTKVSVVPVDGKVAMAAGRLSAMHADPADRFVYAAAVEKGAELVTADEKLLAFARKAGTPAWDPMA